MISRYYFGKDLTVKYSYAEGAEPVGTPTIYLFRDMPGRDAARAGTGALQTVSTWSIDSEIPNTKSFTVAAFTDPEIASTTDGHEYFLAINYTIKAAAEVQTDVKRLFVTRAGGSLTSHGVDLEAVIAAYPTLASYLTNDDIEDQIQLAIDEIAAVIMPVDWDKVTNKDQLYFPILCKAIANSCLSEFVEEGDRFSKRYEIFEKKYADYMANFVVKADSDVSGDSDDTKLVTQDFVLSYR
jgi:hypothetical protein